MARLASSGPAVDRPRDGAGADARRLVLPNGVHIVLRPEPASDLVAISICVRTEPDRAPLDDAAGEIVARSLFSSSFNRSRENIAASLGNVGGSVETLRTAEHVNITCVALPAQIREAVYLLCEVLKNTEFDLLDRTRTELIAEQQRAEPGVTGGLDILRRSLQARPDLADLPYNRITRVQAAAYFHSRYVAERTAIAVVGQFDAELRPDGAARFSGGLRSARRARSANRASVQPRDEFSAAHAGPAWNIGVRPGGYGRARALAAGLSRICGIAVYTGRRALARLFQRIRDTQGIGYSVGAIWQANLCDPLVAYLQWEARPGTGASNAAPVARLSGTASGAPGTAVEAPLPADAALRLLNTQLDNLLSDPPSEAEVERARKVAIGRENLKHERAKDRAFLLAWYEAMGLGADFDSTLPRRLGAVTRDDVLQAARNYLTPRASVVIVPAP